MKKVSVFTFIVFMCLFSQMTQARAFYMDVDDQNEVSTASPYPYVLSQPIDMLPQGFANLKVGEENYYYYDGTFFQKNVLNQKYMIVPPPIGAIVSGIPQDYEVISINGISLYQSQGVFYKRVLDGYKVTYPPAA